MIKRIAFISDHASPLAMLGGTDSGGQNVYVAELARQLAGLGFEIDIFTRWDSLSLPPVINWMQGVRVIHVKAGPLECIPKEELLQYMPEFSENMISFIKQEKQRYSMVHAHFFMSAWVAMEIKHKLKIPFVVTFHALGQVRRIYQGEQDKFPAERITIEGEAVKQANCIIAECPQDKEDLIQYYRAPAERITIIPCGFNPTEFYPVNKSICRQILDLPQDEHVLLQLGRMVPRKGVDNVIRAFGRLYKDKSKKYRLIIVGGDASLDNPFEHPELLRLKAIVKEENLTGAVNFAGPKSRDILKYFYGAADVFISTPWYEPFGITPIEAMACGTPVIGANVGGIKYSIVENECGFLVPPNNPAELAGKVDRLLSDRNLFYQMKKNSIKRVNELFTWNKIALYVQEVYYKIMAENEKKEITKSVVRAA